MSNLKSDAALHIDAPRSGFEAAGSGAGRLARFLNSALSPGRPIWPLATLLLIVFLMMGMMYGALALNQGIRGYSAGESLWSKGRKEAVHQLERYLLGGNEAAWARFEEGLTVPLAFRSARLEMDDPDFRFPVAVTHMIAAGMHPDDAPMMVRLYRWFGWQAQFERAVAIWAEADTHIVALQALALEIRDLRQGGAYTATEIQRLLGILDGLDLKLLPLETAFSQSLGEAARWMQWVLALVLLSGCALLLMLGAFIVRKVTARVFKARTFEAEERFRRTFEVAPVGIAHIGLDGCWTHVNNSLCRMLAYPTQRLIGIREAALLVADSRYQRDEVLPMPGLSDTRQSERHYRRGDGEIVIVQLIVTLVRDIEGRPLNYVAVAHDVTESRRLAQELSHRARHDHLTGLINRYEFESCLKQALERALLADTPSILFYLDLDQFKVVNDSCGHAAGDKMLTEVAALIRGCLRPGDTLARLGGDEFGILLEACPVATAEAIAEKIRSEIAGFRFGWEGRSFSLGASIGMVPFGADESDVTRLLSMADQACFAAKEAGRNQLHISHPDDVSIARHHEEMDQLRRLQQARDEDRLELAWEPIVPVDQAPGDPPRHFEVLLRIREPDGSLTRPGAFLAAAERYGKIIDIDCWVIESLLDWLNHHLDCAERLDRINVNVSGAAMSDARYTDRVSALVGASRFPANRLCFEITETMAISNLDAAVAFMQRLGEFGCRFALDDFGIGSSSFAYLNVLPVDYLKIDGAFVRDIHCDPVHEAITRCIIEVAHALGKSTIAEFVESDAIRCKLRALGCERVQGFAIGAATELGDFIPRPAAVTRFRQIDDAHRVAV